MSYKLKPVNGRVNCLLRSGKDYVKTSLSAMAAQSIVDRGEITESTVTGYPISVNNEWFFEGVKINDKKSSNEKESN